MSLHEQQQKTSSTPITFSFGKNWRSYLAHMPTEAIEHSKGALDDWLGSDSLKGIDVLDIGSGSGVHSYCFHQMGVRSLHSFDYDPHSVTATKQLWQRAGSPAKWRVEQGSVLSQEYMAKLDRADLVYSWGVLHHTGSMWEAIDNAAAMVRPGGRFFIALYTKGPQYAKHLALKENYNQASWLKKKWIIRKVILKRMRKRWRKGKNPFTWNERRMRGMDVYHDLIDWYGGLPYEVASREEVDERLAPLGFELQRIRVAGEGGCSEYLYHRNSEPGL